MKETVEPKKWLRSAWILVVIAIVIAIFLINTLVLWVVYIYGPISHPGAFQYEIEVTGLAGFLGGNFTAIDVPLPVGDTGTAIFPKEKIDSQTFGIWTSDVVSVEGGTMVRFSTREKNLTDIRAVFYQKEEGPMDRRRGLMEGLSPLIPNATTPYTRWIYKGSNQDGPVTKVIIGPGLQPYDKGPSNLTIDLKFYAGGGVVASQERDWYRLSVEEDLPGGVPGSIPVRVQAEQRVNSRWVPYSPGES